MIIVTGGAGFIGSNTIKALNEIGEENIIVVDNIADSKKWENLIGKRFNEYVNKDDLWEWFRMNSYDNIDAIIHLGARTDTLSSDFDYLIRNNFNYSRRLWSICVREKITFLYASSASTYGIGSMDFSDDHDYVKNLIPVNAYGFSKHLFDIWVLKQNNTPPKWYGMKFFNVYGPNETHKGRMASTVYHSIEQANNNSKIKLFKSNNNKYKDGEQKRDFVFVEDTVMIMINLLKKNCASGLYNLGTGSARSFNELAQIIFKEIKKESIIEYFDMPKQLMQQYQNYTKADMTKLISTEIDYEPTSLELGVGQYVKWFFRNRR
jgi:ADP-L-glycero-D-manno-heptose 6-epimerase